jgi:hypothetical protein
MTNITTTFTDKELIDLGRAMECAGFSDPEAYFHWAVNQQTNAILTEQK